MIKAIMHGANGHMGRVISQLVAEEDNIEIIAGVDLNTASDFGYPVYESFSVCENEIKDADVIIDFCSAKATDALLDYCEKSGKPVVLCTTGLSDAQLSRIGDVSKSVAILKSANMSLGINTLFDLLHKATEVFASAGFDIEIVEKHHNKKVDAPSGTAIALADEINSCVDEKYEYIYDRSTRREARDKKELGISAVRGGNIVGEHEVIFAGIDEVITLKHTAYSKSVFAKGAIEAAKFLAGKSAGMYDMKDVIAAK